MESSLIKPPLPPVEGHQDPQDKVHKEGVRAQDKEDQSPEVDNG